MYPDVHSIFHSPTCTWTHVLVGGDGKSAAIIDPVLDYEARSGRTATTAADGLLRLVRERGLRVEWILETHVHADHLTSAAHLKTGLGARTGVGSGIINVQSHFKDVFNLGEGFAADGRQFDHLFADGETFDLGGFTVRVLATPGHTSDSVTYVAGASAFIGDTLFAPDYGSARCDFPGGDARALYRSIRRLYALGGAQRLYLCHDYPAAARAPMPWFTVADQAARNPHLSDETTEAGFVALRTRRDQELRLPEIIIPAVQVNIRAGRLPEPETNGVAYLKVPVNLLGPGE